MAIGAWGVAHIVEGAIFALVALSAAGFLAFVRPRRRVSLALAGFILADLLFVVGLVGSTSVAPYGSTDEAEIVIAFVFGAIQTLGIGALPFLQLLFLSYAIRHDLAASLRAPGVRPALVILALLGPVALLFTPELAEPAWFMCSLVTLFGLLAALAQFVTSARATAQRNQAFAYLIALGVRDALWFVIVIFYQFAAAYQAFVEPAQFAREFGLPLASILSTAFLFVGIARYQFLGADVKVRLTIGRGTLGGIYAAIFLVSTNIVGNWLEEFGWLIGGLITGLMLLFLGPLNRFSMRVASIAVPDAKPITDMQLDERLRLYEHQVQVAWEDGVLRPKEKRMLEVTRGRLGISVAQAHAVETRIADAAAAKRPRTRGGATRA